MPQNEPHSERMDAQKGTKLVMNNASCKVQTLEGVAREMYSLLLLVSAFIIVDLNPLLI